jgi:hypothetical protein
VLSVEILPQGGIDQRLIPSGASGFFRHAKEPIDNVLVQPNRDSGLALGFRLGK